MGSGQSRSLRAVSPGNPDQGQQHKGDEATTVAGDPLCDLSAGSSRSTGSILPLLERSDERNLRAEVKFAKDLLRMEGLAQVRGTVTDLPGDSRLEPAMAKTDRAAALDAQGKYEEAFLVLMEALVLIEELSAEVLGLASRTFRIDSIPP